MALFEQCKRPRANVPHVQYNQGKNEHCETRKRAKNTQTLKYDGCSKFTSQWQVRGSRDGKQTFCKSNRGIWEWLDEMQLAETKTTDDVGLNQAVVFCMQQHHRHITPKPWRWRWITRAYFKNKFSLNLHLFFFRHISLERQKPKALSLHIESFILCG